MTAYVCPGCEKYLETVEEVPGIVHECDDCNRTMEKVNAE